MTIPYLKGVDKVGYGVIRYRYIRGWWYYGGIIALGVYVYRRY